MTSEPIINYKCDDLTVSNPDGSFSTTFTQATIENGPGNLSIGNLDKAINLGTEGKAHVRLDTLNPDYGHFCIRIVLKVNDIVTSRQNIIECDLLPFAIFLERGNSNSNFELIANVAPENHGWSGPDTHFKNNLKINKWYTVVLAYDYDTAALFIDDKLITTHAFPVGTITSLRGNHLFIGSWVDGRRDHFNGSLALIQWYTGIPLEYERLLDEKRSQAEWFITYKYESMKKIFAVGKRTQKLMFDSTTGSHIQYYENCAIMYHDSLGVAFAIQGAIYERFRAMKNNRSRLGYLLSNEEDATDSRGKKNIFSNGAIYWSPSTGAIPVLSNIYLDYENLGESKVLGFPMKPESKTVNGVEQEFQKCRMYYRWGDSNAHEVHGAILDKFLNLGGVSNWGFPITDEMDVKRGAHIIGKFSEFEHCTIFWSHLTGAHEVHGDIRRKYVEINGPLSYLGFPSIDERDIPSYPGQGRITTFQNGSILWYGSYSSIIIARPFNIFLGRISSRENEGFLMGQNDLYFRAKINEDAVVVYNRRHPRRGDWSGHNIKDVNLTFPVTINPNVPSKRVIFSMNIWDADPGNDDRLGSYSKRLDASNGWGLKDNGGIYNETFSKIRSLTWSIKPKIDTTSLSEIEKWWGVRNRGTSEISWHQYASAFRDVDSDTEWWDITDWIQKLFYELVVKGVSKGGNCYGMSLEGINARKISSIFSLPINRITNWNSLKNEFNIKHCYQVGAGPIWWFLGQFITGNTHDPLDVFKQTRREFERGNHPVICITQNYFFTGAPHCILPIEWDSIHDPWKITVCDPNHPNDLKVLTVNPDNNTFRYQPTRSTLYRGGAWSGGRFWYYPYSLLNSPPRTLLWEAIILILSGVIIILAEDSETRSITDAKGNDLNAYGKRATNLLKSGHSINEFFTEFNGLETNIKPGQILLRRDDLFGQSTDPGTANITNLPIDMILKDPRMLKIAKILRRNTALLKKIEDRTPHHVLNDPNTKKLLPANILSGLSDISNINASRNYIHTVRSNKKSKLDYVLKYGLNEIHLNAPMNKNEEHKIEVDDLGTNKTTLKINSARNKLVKLEITNKLGIYQDNIHYLIEDITMNSGKKLSVNLRAGLSGLELVNPGSLSTIKVKIDARIQNRIYSNTFSVPLDKGSRIRPSSITIDKMLVSKIDRLFGPALSTSVVNS